MTFNPVSDAEGYIAAQDREFEKYPTCDICGEHMTEGIELKDGTRICEDCYTFKWFDPEEE